MVSERLAQATPANPPPTMTTVGPSPLLSAVGVMPGLSLREQAVRLAGAPGARGVGVRWRDVTEHRVDHFPGRLDGVLPGEQPAFAASAAPISRS